MVTTNSSASACSSAATAAEQRIQSDATAAAPQVTSFSRSTGLPARIRINGRRKCLGRFDDPAEAHQAYLAAKAQWHVPTVVAGTALTG